MSDGIYEPTFVLVEQEPAPMVDDASLRDDWTGQVPAARAISDRLFDLLDAELARVSRDVQRLGNEANALLREQAAKRLLWEELQVTKRQVRRLAGESAG